MAFDIHRLDRFESSGDDAPIQEYAEEVLALFNASPEGEQHARDHSEAGFWTFQLIEYGQTYVGAALPRMSVNDVRELIEDIFPRKISFQSSDDLDEAIPELIAFWRFLKREFGLRNADAVVRYLESVASHFKGWMTDPAKFGMAKSFMMGGLPGTAPTRRGGLLQSLESLFRGGQGAQRVPEASMPRAAPTPYASAPSRDSKDQARKKAKRKAAKASRKANRKRK